MVLNRALGGDGHEVAERVAGDADEAGLALGLDFAHGGDGLFDDLAGVAELDVVGLEEIDVIGAQAGERLVDGGGDAGGGEVELVGAVAAALGGEDYILAKADEGFAETRFGEGEAVVGGDIEVVDAALDGEMDGGLSLGGIGDAKGVAQRRSAVAEDGDAQRCFAQLTVLHGCLFPRGLKPR